MRPLLFLLLAATALGAPSAHSARLVKRNAGDTAFLNVDLADPGADRYLKWNNTSNTFEWGDPSSGSLDIDALTAATESDIDTDDVFAVSHDGTEKKITLENFVDLLEAQPFTFSTMNVTTLNTTAQNFTEAAAPSTPAAGIVAIYAKTDGLIYGKDDAGTETVLSGGGSATSWDSIGDPSGAGTVAFAATQQLITSTIDTASNIALEISNTDADAANANTILKLSHNDGADAEVTYLLMQGDKDGTPTSDFIFNQSTGLTSLLPINPPSEAYDATGWNGDTGAPQKDAVRDRIEAISTRCIGITVDGGGSVLTTGNKGIIIVPVSGTITSWSLSANASGNITFDVEKAAADTVPSASIVASAPPTMTGDQLAASSTLTGWTTSVTAGEVIEFEITGTPATITRATLQIFIQQ